MNIFEKLVSVLSKGAELDEEEQNKSSNESVLKEVTELSKQQDDDSTIRFFKDVSTGQLRWITLWTSDYLDDDNPPDILSSYSHKDFIERVEKGVVPYPELWHWHTKGTRWGEADWLAYDEDNGVVWASGLIDRGHEKEALALMKSDEEIGVSHGMKDVERDTHDKQVIARYTTYEISDLPLRRAANKMTALFIAEKNKNDTEESMIPKEKLEYLGKVGLDEDTLEKLNKVGEKQSEKFSDRVRKDAEEQEEPEAEEQEKDVVDEEKDNDAENADEESEKADGETGEETEKSEKDEEEGDEKDETPEDSITKEDLMAFIKEGFEGVVGAIERIDAKVGELEKKVKSAEKREKEKELEPLSKAIFSRLRAVGSKEAELEDDDEALNDKPDETDPQNKSLGDYTNVTEFIKDNLFKS